MNSGKSFAFATLTSPCGFLNRLPATDQERKQRSKSLAQMHKHPENISKITDSFQSSSASSHCKNPPNLNYSSSHQSWANDGSNRSCELLKLAGLAFFALSSPPYAAAFAPLWPSFPNPLRPLTLTLTLSGDALAWGPETKKKQKNPLNSTHPHPLLPLHFISTTWSQTCSFMCMLLHANRHNNFLNWEKMTP